MPGQKQWEKDLDSTGLCDCEIDGNTVMLNQGSNQKIKSFIRGVLENVFEECIGEGEEINDINREQRLSEKFGYNKKRIEIRRVAKKFGYNKKRIEIRRVAKKYLKKYG